MTRTMRMVYAEHEEHGTFGLIPENAPSTFEPLGGMGCVHDIVEHIHDGGPDMGSLHDELRAFGVAHWGRGQGGYWTRSMPGRVHTTAPENTHGEICQFFAEWFCGAKDHWFDPCTEVVELDEAGDEMILETMQAVRRHMNDADEFWTPEGEPTFAAQLRPHLDDIHGWLRVGWAWAEERFANVSPWDVITGWLGMEKAINAAITRGHGHWMGEPQLGDVLVLSWSDETAEWGVHWEEPEWDDEDEDSDSEDEVRGDVGDGFDEAEHGAWAWE